GVDVGVSVSSSPSTGNEFRRFFARPFPFPVSGLSFLFPGTLSTMLATISDGDTADVSTRNISMERLACGAPFLAPFLIRIWSSKDATTRRTVGAPVSEPAGIIGKSGLDSRYLIAEQILLVEARQNFPAVARLWRSLDDPKKRPVGEPENENQIGIRGRWDAERCAMFVLHPRDDLIQVVRASHKGASQARTKDGSTLSGQVAAYHEIVEKRSAYWPRLQKYDQFLGTEKIAESEGGKVEAVIHFSGGSISPPQQQDREIPAQVLLKSGGHELQYKILNIGLF
ncbi:hypothetical protein B0H13DRAFT_2486316, partial [Mycena leptocephala]